MPEPVAVRLFMSTIEAEIAHGALEAAGIEAVVSADDCGGMRPHLQVGRVALLVRPEDLEEARRVLDLPATAVDESEP
jgi:hypothetical protein